MAKRGLASASEETRARVARMGGQASRGGGRRPTAGAKGGQSSSRMTQ